MITKNTLVFCLFLFFLLLVPKLISAQVIQGTDSTGLKRPVLVDSNGKLITTTSSITPPSVSVSPNTYTPAKTTTSSIAGTLIDVLASMPVIGYPNWCVVIKNNDSANPLTDAAILESPDGTSWESLYWTACDTLAHGTLCSYCVSGSAYRYIKVQAAAGASATVSSLDVWFTANTN